MFFRLTPLFGALWLVACQPVPLPFQPDNKAVTRAGVLLAPKADASLAVAPLRGVPDVAGEQMAEAVAAALQARGVPAFTDRANKNSWWLFGEFRTDPPVRLEWSLIDPEGLGATNLTTPWPAGQPVPARLTGPQRMAIAKALAPDLEKLVVIDTGPAVQVGEAVLIHGVDGAPGDGNDALLRALRATLQRLQIEVVDTPGAETLIVAGNVRMTDIGVGQQMVEIDWTLMRPDGESLGTVSQRNPVPKGRLDRSWGDIAWVAAEGGAEGLDALIKALPPPAPGAPENGGK